MNQELLNLLKNIMSDKCVCGADSYSKVLDGNRDGEFTILSCDQCDLKRTFPKPLLVENIEEYYTNALDSNDRIDRLELWKKFSDRSLKKINKFITTGKHLDVACNNGVFVKCALDAGFDSRGIDLSSTAIEIGRKELNLGERLATGLLVDGKYPDNQFDLITYLHVLEHIETISSELKEARRILKPGGILYIEVPRFNSIWRRLSPRTWYGYSAHEHIWQFEEKTLTKIIKDNGFAVKKVFKRSSMYHKVDLSVAGVVKLFVHVFALVFATGDNLAIVAVKE